MIEMSVKQEKKKKEVEQVKMDGKLFECFIERASVKVSLML